MRLQLIISLGAAAVYLAILVTVGIVKWRRYRRDRWRHHGRFRKQ
jgi:hypothetical protein